MILSFLVLAIAVMVILAELSISAEESTPSQPDEPGLTFRTIGCSLTGNSYLFVTDSAGNARSASISTTEDCVQIHNAPEAMRLYALWPSGNFGRVMIEADNRGEGYTIGSDDCYLLNLEFATTRGRKLRDMLVEIDNAEYEVSPDLRQECESALVMLQAAEAVEDEADKARLADEALEKILFATEKLLLAKAHIDIERLRKSDGVIRVMDSAGKPLAGAKVDVRQTSRDFLVGSDSMGQRYEVMERFVGIVNFATLPFYLKGLAPRRDEYAWEDRENSIRWRSERGITCKGHPLIWLFDDHLPDYFIEMEWDEKVAFCEENIRKNVERFKGKIDIWDVINEAHGWANDDQPQERLDELTELACKTARAANPDAIIIVNTCLPLSMYVQWKPSQNLSTVYEYFERLNKTQTPYDVVGLQMYNGIASPFPTADIVLMSDILERFSRLGKPIHITEFSVPSDASEWGSWHGEKWNEQTQGEYVKAFYTLAFSKPYVGAVTWWCFWDANTWVPSTGVLREDLSEKPAFHALKELVESWTTEASGSTDEEGIFRFRGFHGGYEVKVRTSGEEKTADLQLGQEPVETTIRF